jgi:hypothetical protein
MTTTITCPNAKRHTKQPAGYVAWFEWAEKKGKTHRQIRCHGCNLLKIWIPKRDAGGE